MSAKPSPLPDPDLSPARGETQDRRKVGLKKETRTVNPKALNTFDWKDYDESMGVPDPKDRQEDTIVPDRRAPVVLEGSKPIPPAKPGDKRRVDPIPNLEQPKNRKFQASAKPKQSKHAYSVTYKT